jgi:hypothetical protein
VGWKIGGHFAQIIAAANIAADNGKKGDQNTDTDEKKEKKA